MSTEKIQSLIRQIPKQARALFPNLPFLPLRKQQLSGSPGLPASRLACDFGQSKIVFVELRILENRVHLLHLQKIQRPAEREKIPAALVDCLTRGGIGPRKVRVSVKGQGVVVRFVQFPKMKPEELKSAIAFEAEKYIPFKSDEVLLDFAILEDEVTGPQGPLMNLLLVAVKRDEMYPFLEIFHQAGLQVELVDIDALAFLNAVEFFYPDAANASAGILDIGAETSTLSIVKEGKPRFIRDISFGGIDILKRLKRKLGLADQAALSILEGEQEPSPEMLAVLKEGLGNLVSDLQVSLDYYMDQTQAPDNIKVIYLGGGASCHPIVTETLSQELHGITVQTMNVLDKIQIETGVDAEWIKRNQGILPVALGLCLRDV